MLRSLHVYTLSNCIVLIHPQIWCIALVGVSHMIVYFGIMQFLNGVCI